MQAGSSLQKSFSSDNLDSQKFFHNPALKLLAERLGVRFDSKKENQRIKEAYGSTHQERQTHQEDFNSSPTQNGQHEAGAGERSPAAVKLNRTATNGLTDSGRLELGQAARAEAEKQGGAAGAASPCSVFETLHCRMCGSPSERFHDIRLCQNRFCRLAFESRYSVEAIVERAGGGEPCVLGSDIFFWNSETKHALSIRLKDLSVYNVAKILNADNREAA